MPRFIHYSTNSTMELLLLALWSMTLAVCLHQFPEPMRMASHNSWLTDTDSLKWNCERICTTCRKRSVRKTWWVRDNGPLRLYHTHSRVTFLWIRDFIHYLYILLATLISAHHTHMALKPWLMTSRYYLWKICLECCTWFFGFPKFWRSYLRLPIRSMQLQRWPTGTQALMEMPIGDN